MKRTAGLIFLTLLLVGCDQSPPAKPAGPQPQSLPTIDLPLGNRTFTLQVADDQPKRETGLMYVRSMPPERGMIFLFSAEQVQGFWMQNTPIDLDIVFVNRAGSIVAVKTMYAFDTTTIYSDEPADIAIELNAGAAKAAGIAVGDKAAIPAELLDKAR